MTTPADELPAGVAAAPPGPGDGPQYFSHGQILVVLVGVMAGMLLFALDQGIVGTALPRIVSELGGLDKLSWVVTAYLLTSTATTPRHPWRMQQAGRASRDRRPRTNF
jgi:hypothetical protein